MTGKRDIVKEIRSKAYIKYLLMDAETDIRFPNDKCQFKNCNNKPQIDKNNLKGDMYICQEHRIMIVNKIKQSMYVNKNSNKNEDSKESKKEKSENISKDSGSTFLDDLTLSDQELMTKSNECQNKMVKDYFARYNAEIECALYTIRQQLSNLTKDRDMERLTRQHKTIQLQCKYKELKCLSESLLIIRKLCNPIWISICRAIQNAFARIVSAIRRTNNVDLIVNLTDEIKQNEQFSSECQTRIQKKEMVIKKIRESRGLIQKLKINDDIHLMDRLADLETEYNNLKDDPNAHQWVSAQLAPFLRQMIVRKDAVQAEMAQAANQNEPFIQDSLETMMQKNRLMEQQVALAKQLKNMIESEEKGIKQETQNKREYDSNAAWAYARKKSEHCKYPNVYIVYDYECPFEWSSTHGHAAQTKSFGDFMVTGFVSQTQQKNNGGLFSFTKRSNTNRILSTIEDCCRRGGSSRRVHKRLDKVLDCKDIFVAKTRPRDTRIQRQGSTKDNGFFVREGDYLVFVVQ